MPVSVQEVLAGDPVKEQADETTNEALKSLLKMSKISSHKEQAENSGDQGIFDQEMDAIGQDLDDLMDDIEYETIELNLLDEI